jgi:hypothetical protein
MTMRIFDHTLVRDVTKIGADGKPVQGVDQGMSVELAGKTIPMGNRLDGKPINAGAAYVVVAEGLQSRDEGVIQAILELTEEVKALRLEMQLFTGISADTKVS